MIGTTPITVYIGTLLIEIGLSYEVLPGVLLATGIGAVACGTMAGRVADHLGNVRTGLIARAAILVTMTLYLALPHLPRETLLPMMLTIAAVHGFVGRAYYIASSSQMAHLAPTAVPVAISLHASTFQVGERFRKRPRNRSQAATSDTLAYDVVGHGHSR